MTRSACLIFNPVAGQGNSEQDLATIKSILEPEFELDLQQTTEEVSGGELARRAVEREVEMVIASGGDGTVSAVAEALINSDIPLGVISRGTANAFANALDIPDRVETACKVIVDGATRKVDAAICNEKPMILLAGIGFEAETVEDADRQTKDRLGMLAYVLSGLKQLKEFKKFATTIETEDKIIRVDANAITVANAAPNTSVLAQGTAGVIYDDGLLDVTIITPTTRAGAIAISYHLLQSASNDEAASREDIGYLRTKKVKVTTEPPQKIALDGEIIGETPVEIECLPQALTVFIPREKAVQATEKLDHLPGIQIEYKDAGDRVKDEDINLKSAIEQGTEIKTQEFLSE